MPAASPAHPPSVHRETGSPRKRSVHRRRGRTRSGVTLRAMLRAPPCCGASLRADRFTLRYGSPRRPAARVLNIRQRLHRPSRRQSPIAPNSSAEMFEILHESSTAGVAAAQAAGATACASIAAASPLACAGRKSRLRSGCGSGASPGRCRPAWGVGRLTGSPHARSQRTAQEAVRQSCRRKTVETDRLTCAGCVDSQRPL